MALHGRPRPPDVAAADRGDDLGVLRWPDVGLNPYGNSLIVNGAFLQKNPKNRLVPEAVFNLGESYFQRGKHTDAAREYLKISTTYASSARAPDALLRLGQSLVAFGGKEQACASFAEIGRKYPNASQTVKAAAEREVKKNQC